MPQQSFLNPSGWHFAVLVVIWVGMMVVATHFAPPPPAPAASKSTSTTDAIACTGLDTGLYGNASDHGKQLAATIIDEYNDVADPPLAPVTLAHAQLALLNYCQAHPTKTLREAVEATWRTL